MPTTAGRTSIGSQMTICGRQPLADSARRIAIWHCKCLLQMAVAQLVEAVQPLRPPHLRPLQPYCRK